MNKRFLLAFALFQTLTFSSRVEAVGGDESDLSKSRLQSLLAVYLSEMFPQIYRRDYWKSAQGKSALQNMATRLSHEPEHLNQAFFETQTTHRGRPYRIVEVPEKLGLLAHQFEAPEHSVPDQKRVFWIFRDPGQLKERLVGRVIGVPVSHQKLKEKDILSVPEEHIWHTTELPTHEALEILAQVKSGFLGVGDVQLSGAKQSVDQKSLTSPMRVSKPGYEDWLENKREHFSDFALIWKSTELLPSNGDPFIRADLQTALVASLPGSALQAFANLEKKPTADYLKTLEERLKIPGFARDVNKQNIFSNLLAEGLLKAPDAEDSTNYPRVLTHVITWLAKNPISQQTKEHLTWLYPQLDLGPQKILREIVGTQFDLGSPLPERRSLDPDVGLRVGGVYHFGKREGLTVLQDFGIQGDGTRGFHLKDNKQNHYLASVAVDPQNANQILKQRNLSAKLKASGKAPVIIPRVVHPQVALYSIGNGIPNFIKLDELQSQQSPQEAFKPILDLWACPGAMTRLLQPLVKRRPNPRTRP